LQSKGKCSERSPLVLFRGELGQPEVVVVSFALNLNLNLNLNLVKDQVQELVGPSGPAFQIGRRDQEEAVVDDQVLMTRC
jgi:hypothetical protein